MDDGERNSSAKSGEDMITKEQIAWSIKRLDDESWYDEAEDVRTLVKERDAYREVAILGAPVTSEVFRLEQDTETLKAEWVDAEAKRILERKA